MAGRIITRYKRLMVCGLCFVWPAVVMGSAGDTLYGW